MMILQAHAVGVDDSDGCLTLGFAEEADGSGPALVMQRENDAYSMITDTQATTTGGIDSWQLAEGWLKLTLSTKAAEELGVDTVLFIQFAPVHTDIVRSAFARILGNA